MKQLIIKWIGLDALFATMRRLKQDNQNYQRQNAETLARMRDRNATLELRLRQLEKLVNIGIDVDVHAPANVVVMIHKGKQPHNDLVYSFQMPQEALKDFEHITNMFKQYNVFVDKPHGYPFPNSGRDLNLLEDYI